MEYEAGAKSLSRRKIRVAPGQLRLFAKAIGETNQIYFDQAAAESAGLRAPLAPPTFAYSLGVLAFGSDSWSEDLGIDQARLLHGEQAFAYFQPLHSEAEIPLLRKVVGPI